MSNWTNPKTWVTGDVVTADDLNTEVRDNLMYLKSANTYSEVSADMTYSTASASWADIDPTNLSLSVTTRGGLLMLSFEAVIRMTDDRMTPFFDITINGTRQGGTYGLGQHIVEYNGFPAGDFIKPLRMNIQYWRANLPAGTYVLRPQWRIGDNITDGNLTHIESVANGGMPTRLSVLEVNL